MLDSILEDINPKLKVLESHPLYKKINSLESLRFFMERHVYAVFDFMSLSKSIQAEFAPINKLWTPPKNKELSRFINEIILAEESDLTPDNTFMSHFEMYCIAMDEIKANNTPVQAFIHTLKDEFPFLISKELCVPISAQNFMKDTFLLIKNGKAHEIAASFCFGREKIIPIMFKSLLEEMNIDRNKAPMFYYYLNRHIEIDGDSHGPLALKMLTILCGQDPQKWNEVKLTALNSIESRITFWDNVLEEMDCSLKGNEIVADS